MSNTLIGTIVIYSLIVALLNLVKYCSKTDSFKRFFLNAIDLFSRYKKFYTDLYSKRAKSFVRYYSKLFIVALILFLIIYYLTAVAKIGGIGKPSLLGVSPLSIEGLKFLFYATLFSYGVMLSVRYITTFNMKFQLLPALLLYTLFIYILTLMFPIEVDRTYGLLLFVRLTIIYPYLYSTTLILLTFILKCIFTFLYKSLDFLGKYSGLVSVILGILAALYNGYIYYFTST